MWRAVFVITCLACSACVGTAGPRYPQASPAYSGRYLPPAFEAADPQLNAVQRGYIGDHVRECWQADNYATGPFQVHLIVTTDANGVARQAEIAPGDPAAPLGSPLHAFAERAVRAVLTAQCSALPLPPTMMGQIHRFDFIFATTAPAQPAVAGTPSARTAFQEDIVPHGDSHPRDVESKFSPYPVGMAPPMGDFSPEAYDQDPTLQQMTETAHQQFGRFRLIQIAADCKIIGIGEYDPFSMGIANDIAAREAEIAVSDRMNPLIANSYLNELRDWAIFLHDNITTYPQEENECKFTPQQADQLNRAINLARMRVQIEGARANAILGIHPYQ